MSKALPKGDEKAKAGRRRRAVRLSSFLAGQSTNVGCQGTWYFMSIRSLAYPGRALGIADELESFLHVTIFLAIRFVRSTYTSYMVHDFVRTYFDDAQHGEDGRYICSETKISTIEHAKLRIGNKPIVFLTGKETFGERGQLLKGDDQPRHPFNLLLHHLLKLFQARYAVEEWHEEQLVVQAKAASTASKLPSQLSIMSPSAWPGTEDETPEPPDAMSLGDDELTRTFTITELCSSTISQLSPETFRQSKMLDDHTAVLAIFKLYLDSARNEWPFNDKIKDQLDGYTVRHSSANVKKPRLVVRSTLLAIRKGDEQPLRARTGL